MKITQGIKAMENFFWRFLSSDPRELLPGRNHVTDPSARDHPSGFLLALKEAGRNGFPQLPTNYDFATAPSIAINCL
jgi:hypothetical protein